MHVAGEAIFISYRRGDAAGSARALYLVLRNWFGADRVFYDQAGLQPGEAFPARLRTAIEGARVTLAIIGPAWLTELNRRYRDLPSEIDVVREELKLALALQRAQAAKRHVVPVLMECEAMPAIAGLDTALQPDLADLWQHDARALGGKQQRWDRDVHALLLHLGQVLQMAPLATAGDAVRIAGAQAAVRKQLALVSLEPLRLHWGDDPLSGFTMDRLEDSVVAYAQAIDAALPDWRHRRLDTEALMQVKQGCRGVLAALYGLAIDGSAARAWLEEPDSGRPVPVASLGALAFAYATVHGKKTQISASLADRGGFEPEDAVDLGAPDPGGTLRRRAMVHKRY
jgi:TIR domain